MLSIPAVTWQPTLLAFFNRAIILYAHAGMSGTKRTAMIQLTAWSWASMRLPPFSTTNVQVPEPVQSFGAIPSAHYIRYSMPGTSM